MAKELYTNGPSGVVASDAASGDTTISLVSTSAFPASGQYTVKCDAEIMLVTANNTGTHTLTVTRAQEGTTAAAHTAGSALWGCLTDGSLRRLVVASHAGTLVGSRRQFNFVDGGGATWTLTDDGTNDKVDVSVAVSGGGGGGSSGGEATYTVPALTDYTWVNQGTATANDDGQGVFLKAPPASQNNLRALVISTGATPWSYVARFAVTMVPAASANCGLALRDSSSGKMIAYRYVAGTINDVDFTNATTYSAGPGVTTTMDPADARWMKISDDGTTRTLSISQDGTNWIVWATWTHSNFMTPDQVGFYAEGATSGFDTGIKLVSAKLN